MYITVIGNSYGHGDDDRKISQQVLSYGVGTDEEFPADIEKVIYGNHVLIASYLIIKTTAEFPMGWALMQGEVKWQALCTDNDKRCSYRTMH